MSKIVPAARSWQRREDQQLTVAELNAGFPPRYARGHAISPSDLRRLAETLGVEPSEELELLLTIEFQFTVERLLAPRRDLFRALEGRLNFRDLERSLYKLRTSNEECRPAAVAVDGALSGRRQFYTTKAEREARALVAGAKRKRGRPFEEVIDDFLWGLFRIASDFQANISLPSNGEQKATKFISFVSDCASIAQSIGEAVIWNRPELSREEMIDARNALLALRLSDRAFTRRLRAIRQASENKP